MRASRSAVPIESISTHVQRTSDPHRRLSSIEQRELEQAEITARAAVTSPNHDIDKGAVEGGYPAPPRTRPAWTRMDCGMTRALASHR
jgi:hypothetical protein